MSDCPAFNVCGNPSECWGEDPELTATCWGITWSSLAIGVASLIHANLLVPRGIGFWSAIESIRQKRKLQTVERGLCEKPVAPFVSYHRNLANFCRDNTDNVVIPPPYEGEYEPIDLGSSIEASFAPVIVNHFIHFMAIDGGSIFWSALGWGMLTSSFATFLWLVLYHEDSYHKNVECNETGQRPLWDYFDQAQSVTAAFYSCYVFFPTFLLAGYVSYVALRWRDFLVNCHTIQARIHDVALTCGMSVQRPVRMDTRRRLFKIYRYLSCIHAITYQSVSDSIGPLSLQRGDFTALGLLTMNEVRVLMPMDNKIRDTLMTWLGGAVNELIHKDAIQPAPVLNILTAKICDLRGICARHHDSFVRDNPNTYVHFLLVVVMLWLACFVTTSPWRMTIYSGGEAMQLGAACFQHYVLVCNILIISTVNSCVALVRLLRNPFALTVERIKVDNLIASTDRCIFASLRGLFDEINSGDEQQLAASGEIGGEPLQGTEQSSCTSKSVSFTESPRMRTGPRARKTLSKATTLRDVREI
eukprot:CAMPEP_0172539082 /NCGR_PEP_ID=MMETSP1067-20121228/10349_1 /TAXON_ID=265564 ORGANISM="Thalassiosira punctigera, Strain Tpunct2005C2" /NCGR_SAMPLE_ID=MMETSP1067 /ASSEMBLY_ACC=CAM_ASM_000444 /LENGTH=529 /DNA_ID=CAMNT_0013324707 /DNA_START=74 /DNA_END=1663 /DNA_ORIENTATION=-